MPFVVKVHIVMQRMNVPNETGDNVRVLDAFLTRKAAEDLVDKVPGTFIEKRAAGK